MSSGSRGLAIWPQRRMICQQTELSRLQDGVTPHITHSERYSSVTYLDHVEPLGTTNKSVGIVERQTRLSRIHRGSNAAIVPVVVIIASHSGVQLIYSGTRKSCLILSAVHRAGRRQLSARHEACSISAIRLSCGAPCSVFPLVDL